MRNFEPLSGSESPSVLVSRLDFHIRTLLQKDDDVERARRQVTADVEKLIRDKAEFQDKVTEMADLYKTLQAERHRLKDIRVKLYKDLP
jgi:hypothetical protein